MPLDPQVEQLLDQMKQIDMLALNEMPVPEARAALQGFRELSGPGEDVASVDNLVIAGPAGEIPARLYRPVLDGGALPVVVYFHGGGWVLGDLGTHEGTCRSLANRSGAAVVSVDYRLAPEAPFPAAVDDAFAAVRWAAAHGERHGLDAGRLAVAGDSAGGNLAAVVALLARDAGGPPIAFQLLIYPVTDARMQWDSMKDNGEGYLLTEADMTWFYGLYGAPPDDWRVSPLLADDLSGLPPAMVITAEYDPLRDEGIAYAERLRDAGVVVELNNCAGMIHGFFALGAHVDATRPVVDAAGAALRRALH